MVPPRSCCTARSSSSKRSSQRGRPGDRTMSEAYTNEFESLLRRALQPVDPPEDLATRMEATLAELTTLAQDELESWELGAMRDPRNWVRPVAAVAVGT